MDELYSVDKGYKICLKVYIYYQSDFLSLILFIAPMKVNIITCAEKISDGAILIHEFDSIEKRK